ncbi:MAG: hypothetical protein IPJ85_13205 [Flavobacteriales bacterium]|nr:hypothetical protein [Flavobacteriales bacterium]
MKRASTLFMCALSVVLSAKAQGDLAYMPAIAPERTADDASIEMHETSEPGIVRFAMPPGTHRVDLLNAQGNVIEQLSDIEVNAFDINRLRAGTWTLRAHTPAGIRVRRFVVHHQNGQHWVNEVKTAQRR